MEFQLQRNYQIQKHLTLHGAVGNEQLLTIRRGEANSDVNYRKLWRKKELHRCPWKAMLRRTGPRGDEDSRTT